MPICSMGILELGTLILKETMLAGKPVSRKLCHRPRPRSGISMLVRVVAGPHHRSRFNVAETEAQSLVPQVGKLLRLIEASDGQVILRRTQILPDRKNVNAARAQIAENFDQLW